MPKELCVRARERWWWGGGGWRERDSRGVSCTTREPEHGVARRVLEPGNAQLGADRLQAFDPFSVKPTNRRAALPDSINLRDFPGPRQFRSATSATEEERTSESGPAFPVLVRVPSQKNKYVRRVNIHWVISIG